MGPNTQSVRFLFSLVRPTKRLSTLIVLLHNTTLFSPKYVADLILLSKDKKVRALGHLLSLQFFFSPCAVRSYRNQHCTVYRYCMGHEPNVMATSVGHKTHSANFHKGCNVLHMVCVLEEQICYNRGCLIEILLAYN